MTASGNISGIVVILVTKKIREALRSGNMGSATLAAKN
jgi:hypothetical protein